jgi:hypothetical protein
MTPQDHRFRIDFAAVRYLEALERDDFDTIAALWHQAGADTDLEVVLCELHAGLIEERVGREVAKAATELADAVRTHLTSADVLCPDVGPVTVADVAEALFRRPPARLPPDAHRLNDKLRSAHDQLPEHLGLSKLIEWAEARFGKAVREYWVAFREAALEIDLRRASEAEYQMAARPVPPKPRGPE